MHKAVIASYGRSDEEHVTVALDPAGGRTRWERKDYVAGSVVGDRPAEVGRRRGVA
ncbi:hypothetical protein OG943_29280 [Amycolatopsis sp. NBC_00345]|uniref:hypothetical protein n=1 Tax=Amycolatopsis sp. NBC_00345 TaxID=2975955 RepID=UPI002E276D5F